MAAAVSFAAPAVVHDGSHLARVSTAFETPHLNWAKPLAGGPVRVLFIAPRNFGAREVVELAERMDLDFRAVTTYTGTVLAHEDRYEAGSSGTSPAEKTAELLKALDRPVDVIVLANECVTNLPSEAQYRIVKHVADGGGLLTTYAWRFPFPEMLTHAVALPEGLSAVASSGLPAVLQPLDPSKWIRAATFQKGRVLRLEYPGPHSTPYGAMGLTARQSYSDDWSARYENNLALVAQALLWAAQREPPCAVRLETDASGIFAADVVFTNGIGFRVSGRVPKASVLRVRIRNSCNDVMEERDLPVADRGEAEVRYHPEIWPQGRLFVDARLQSPRGVEAFGAWVVQADGPVGAATLATDRASYEAGMTVRATLKLERPSPRPLDVRVRLDDLPFGNGWARTRMALPAGATEAVIELTPPSPWPTHAGQVICGVYDGPRQVAEGRATLLFPRRDRPIYSSIGWDGIPVALAPPFARAMDKIGWEGSLQHPFDNGANARVLALFNQRIVPYMTRIGVSADAQGHTLTEYLLGATPDEIASVSNDQSFYNPAVQALWKKTIARRMPGLAETGPLVYNLGDENHFSYDAGYAPSDDPEFHRFLKDFYGDVETLNREWNTAYASFDQAPHASSKALRESRNYAAWHAHRTFMEKQYADVHHYLARCIKELDPTAQVGAEGSPPGDMERIVSGLDFWGPYSDLVGDELLRSVAADKFRTLWWGGYVGSHGGRDSFPYPLWRPLLQGTVNGSAWFSGGISNEGFFAADLTFAEYFEKMLPRLHRLQNGLGPLLIDQPLRNDGIAMLWSQPSFSASQMAPSCTSPRDGATVLITACYQQGLTVDFVTPRRLAAGALDRYRFLLAPGAGALSAADLASLRSFVERGGVLVADLNPGVMNEYCRMLPTSAAADLFGAPAFDGNAALVTRPWAFQAVLRDRPVAFRAANSKTNPQLPPFCVNRIGEGYAILLNGSLGALATSADTNTPMSTFLLDLLALADVQPAVTVTGLDPKQTLLRVREKGACTLMGLVADKEAVGRTVTFHLTKKQYVYRADGGFLDRSQEIPVPLEEPFVLLSGFDEKQKEPDLRLDRQTIAPGSALTLDRSRLDPDALYRLEVLDPDRRPVPHRMRIFAGAGKESDAEIRWAYTDAPGRYRVRLTDVRTGLSSERGVRVKP